MRFRERAQRLGPAIAVEHPTSSDDHRLLRRAQQLCRDVELRGVGRRGANADERRRKERLRIVVSLRLHVLRQRERHGAALCRIGQDGDGARQRSQQLRRRDDAIEVPRYRLHAVVGRDAAVVKVLELLQHGIRRARDEDVAREEQHGKPVDVRRRGGRHEVGRAGPDRRRARHHPPPEVGFRERDRRMPHRLLVVGPISRQFLAVAIERLAQPRDVAVAEDRPDAGEQRHLAAVANRSLRRQIAHERLRHRQSKRCHRVPLSFSYARSFGPRPNPADSWS
jgi:hypothetical protein